MTMKVEIDTEAMRELLEEYAEKIVELDLRVSRLEADALRAWVEQIEQGER